jgi:acyl-CoA thioester hydrolase
MASTDNSSARQAATLVFQTILPMRWGDMDAMGHMNNTLYFRFMEETRIQWFGLCGFEPNPQGEGPVIINAACSFLRQFEYPNTILCRHYVGEIGRSSFETYVDMLPADNPNDAPWAQGSAKCVWVNFPAQRSAPLPPLALEQIQKLRV